MPWPGYGSLADPTRALELEPAEGAARFDHGFPAGMRSAWALASLAVLREPGWGWVHERADLAGRRSRSGCASAASTSLRAGDSTLVSWDSRGPSGRGRAAGRRGHHRPQHPRVRARAGVGRRVELRGGIGAAGGARRIGCGRADVEERSSRAESRAEPECRGPAGRGSDRDRRGLVARERRGPAGTTATPAGRLPALRHHALPAAVPRQPVHPGAIARRRPGGAFTSRRTRCRPNTPRRADRAAEYDRNDGFSPGSALIVHVAGLDNAQAFGRTGPVGLLDMAGHFARSVTDRRHRRGDRAAAADLLRARRATPTTPADTNLLIHPGKNFTEGHTYVVALRNLRNARGRADRGPGWFARLRDGRRLPARRARQRAATPDLRRPAPRRDRRPQPVRGLGLHRRLASGA